MAGWNYTVYTVAMFSVAGSFFANGLAYSFPGSKWMFTSRLFALGLTAAACLLTYVLNVRGLHLTKWWSDAGALLTVATFLALVSLLIRAWLLKLPSARFSFSLALPSFSILTLNVFTKMAISAALNWSSHLYFLPAPSYLTQRGFVDAFASHVVRDVVIDGAGHFIAEEQPEAFEKAASSFLAE